MGLAWKDCCRDWVARYASDELTQGVGELGSWWSRNHQQEIDIVGLGRRERDGYALLGTCKWARSMDDRPLRQLVAYRDLLGKPALRARLVAFAKSGFTPQAEEFAAAERIALHTVADLFPPR
jgi:4-aminobutyrate aminotransferase-like enzyme